MTFYVYIFLKIVWSFLFVNYCRSWCFYWRNSINSYCCSGRKYGCHIGTTLSYQWFDLFSLSYCILMIAILWFLFSLWSYPNIIMFVHANVCQPLFSKLTNLIWISWSILGSFWFEKSQFHEIMIKLTRNKLKSTGCHCKIKIRIAID